MAHEVKVMQPVDRRVRFTSFENDSRLDSTDSHGVSIGTIGATGFTVDFSEGSAPAGT